MPPATIRSPPSLADYMPLAEYQSQTPESFTDGKPILHFHLPGAKATIPSSQRGSLAVFPADAPVAGDGLVEQTVDVFVSSGNFTIFSQQTESGVSIPYPTISIHAIKQVSGSPAIWMQLDFADGGDDDDDFQTVELTIIPPSPAAASPASQLYEAIANCSNLHPDPNNGEGEEDDEEDDYDRIVFEGGAEHEAIEGFTGVLRGAADGGLPPPMPGSSGWITADNVHEFFDQDGNWVGAGEGEEEEEGEGEVEELGEGAGRTRPRDELEKDDGINGHGQSEDPENKRPRVD